MKSQICYSDKLLLFVFEFFLGRFFDKVKNIKEILGIILLGLLFFGIISEILNLLFDQNYENKQVIHEITLILQIFIIGSGLIGYVFSLIISYSFIFGDLKIGFIDGFNKKIHKILLYDRKNFLINK